MEVIDHDAVDEEEVEVELTGSESHIDDPVRIYLMQMGEIPLLTRKEEIVAAKRIEKSRTHFRNAMLATDYALHTAVSLLEKVHDGRLRLDRTIEVSVTNIREKRHIMGVSAAESAYVASLAQGESQGFCDGYQQVAYAA